MHGHRSSSPFTFSAKTTVIALAVFVAACLAAVYLSRCSFFKYAGEDMQLFSEPTAARAFELGIMHFDAIDAQAYDVDRAARLFQIANMLDPKYPNVHHQLARIEFLRGDFDAALNLVDQELRDNPKPSASSYYLRGLIEGYMEDYDASAKDYRAYIATDPTNWAATNDLAWVLLKAHRYQEALDAIDKVLPLWPENPWLLNSRTIALSELKRFDEAEVSSRKALDAVMRVTTKDWSQAYPGNDPLIAPKGLLSFQSSVVSNMHSIMLARDEAAKVVQ